MNRFEVFIPNRYDQGLCTTVPILKGTFVCKSIDKIIIDEKFHEHMTNLYSKDQND